MITDPIQEAIWRADTAAMEHAPDPVFDFIADLFRAQEPTRLHDWWVLEASETDKRHIIQTIHDQTGVWP